MISKNPFANAIAPPTDEFKRMQAGGFKEWRLVVDGTVAHPLVLSLSRSEDDADAQPDHRGGVRGRVVVYCGVDRDAAFAVLREAGVLPQTRYIVYYAVEKSLWGSIDMADAMDPHTLLTMGMNDGDLPVPFGGPLRLRLPRQLGYKSLKFVTHITATDDIKKFGKGLGSVDPEYGYSWYAGI